MRGPSSRAIPRRSDGGPAPLSFAERRLWFLDRFEPGNPAYNVGIALRFDGRLHAAALERSLAEIVRRHETLRTSFAEADGEAFQRIAPSVALELPSIDLRGLAPEQREEQARRLAAEEARRPFDLREGALLRSTLLRLDEDAHILLIVMHHVICDGWSVGVLARELCALYEAFRQGRPSPLPELPIQYADFAVWQRGWLQGEVLDRLLSYWKARLAGPLPVLELPADRPRPPVQTYRGARESLAIPRALIESLRALGLREGATLFMTLLAAFQVLLHRYTGEKDVVVGSAIANRNRIEVEGLIGFFVNTLVLRTDLSGDPSFRELLSRVRRVAEGAYSHQDLPFEMLVEELHPEREMSRAPLFQVSFSLQNIPMPAGELPGLSLSLLRIDNRTSKFDISLYLVETEEGLLASAEYNTDLFDRETVSRMLRNYRTLLEGIAASPERRISALPLLTEAERRQLLVEWNDTRMEEAEERTIHRLFEAQAEKSPDAIAVVFGEQRLTYRELNARANQLAHHLCSLGVGPETLVGLCVERSLELVVGLLGILKAGGTYVPLNPAYPAERLAFMLEDAGASLLLTQERLAGTLPAMEKVVLLDTGWEEIERESAENFQSGAVPENLAYVLYTSGSTGRPKGVMIAHRGLCNLSEAQLRTFSVSPACRVLQFASASFDASIFEIIMALRAGATLFLGTLDSLMPGPGLIAFLRDRAITHVTLTPSALAALPRRELPALETIVVAGESCPAELVARWAPGRRFFNAYGPTETTVWATAAECADGSGPPPIGRPIANMRAYVLDSYGGLAPVGVHGELYLAGAGLARGYWKSPELTAEKFTADPFSREPGARLYRTGDMARYRPDGNLEFLGRLDHQVKVRGFRVEPLEIESILTGHPLVHESAVVARRDTLGETRLVAYVVAEKASAPTVTELREMLSEKLPDPMVPSAFVFIERLPLTSSGKVDHAALPEPGSARPELPTDDFPPRTPLEKAIAGIWSAVLKLDHVGIHDDFFALGGHSLLGTRVVSRMRQVFGVEVPLRALFERPTVAGLAPEVARMQAGIGREELAGILVALKTFSDDDARRLLGDPITPGGGDGGEKGVMTNPLPPAASRQPRRVAPTNAFTPFPKEAVERSIPDRFESQVLRCPDRLAVKAGDLQLSYQDLNRAANRVADAVLARCGAGEEPVALLFEHGAPSVTAILGVLKAGKICVPLDPSYPEARSAFLLEDSGAALLLTNAMTSSQGAGLASGRCAALNLDEAGPDVSEENPGLPTSPESPAWILYTSGSTGRPKGTVQTHRTVLHNILRYTNGLHIREEDRLTLLHSYCFGGSAHNTFGALLNGASLFPYDIRKEGLLRLAGWLAGEELTIYHSVPMVFRQLVASLSGEEAAFPRLRLIKLGGESVSRRDVSLYRTHFSESCLLHVALGTTEMPNFRQFFLDHDTDFSGSVVPVGYAVPDAEVLVLDEAGQSVGANVLGEIVVKSRYLSPGYWRRPDLTREAFLVGSNSGGERTYRTGDLGYLLPDGCLVHAGRKDFQVKIRGHRIEIAEVEAALLEIDGIREAAVAARPDRDGGQRLVAYLAAGPTPAPPVSELQKALKQKLPEALIPSAVVYLDSLPSTPNGKLDRRALPDPTEPCPDRAPSFVAPRSSTEAILASVWSEVLRLSRVGVHDDFFALGGDSLKATQVLLRLHRLLGVDLPLPLFFENRTIAGLAGAIAQCPAETAARDGALAGRSLDDRSALPSRDL